MILTDLSLTHPRIPRTRPSPRSRYDRPRKMGLASSTSPATTWTIIWTRPLCSTARGRTQPSKVCGCILVCTTRARVCTYVDNLRKYVWLFNCVHTRAWMCLCMYVDVRGRVHVRGYARAWVRESLLPMHGTWDFCPHRPRPEQPVFTCACDLHCGSLLDVVRLHDPTDSSGFGGFREDQGDRVHR